MPNDLGYAHVQKLQQKICSQQFRIAKACINSVTQGPILHQNNKASLIPFSAKINSCRNTLVRLDYLHKMGNLNVLTKIARPLQISWLNGWQADTDNVTHHKMCKFSICDLANYASLRTRQIVNLSVTGHELQSQQSPTIIKQK